MYPTEQVNVDGYNIHAKPCGRCQGREGCSNRADRVVAGDNGELLAICKVRHGSRPISP